MPNGGWAGIQVVLLAAVMTGCSDGDGTGGDDREAQATVVIDVGTNPTGVAATDTAVWVTDPDDATVTRVDPETGEIVATIEGATSIEADEVFDTIVPGPGSPDAVAATDTDVWLTDQVGGVVSLSRLDPATNEVVDTVDAGSGGTTGDVAATDSAVWVTNGSEADGHTLTRVNADTGEVADTITVGESTSGVAATATDVWVADFDGSVIRVDPETGEDVDRIPISESSPGDVAATATDVWVTDFDGGILLRIDPETGDVIETIDVGEGVTGVAATDTAVWVIHGPAGTLTRVE